MSGSGGFGWRIKLLGLMPGVFLPTIQMTTLAIAIPSLMNTFALTAVQAQWIVVTYALAQGVIIPVSGWAGNRLGQKRALLAALSLFTVGSTLCAVAPSLFVLIAGRVVQGIGGGALIPLTMTMIQHVAPKEKIGSAMGIWSVTAMTSAALGPTLGGLIVQLFDWRGIFWFALPVGIMGLSLAVVLIDSSVSGRPKSVRFDLAGFVTLAVGIVALQMALSQGPVLGWASGRILTFLAVSILALGGFVRLQLTRSEPLLDLRLFRSPMFRVSAVGIALTMAAVHAGLYFLQILLQPGMGLSPQQAGLIIFPSAVVGALLQPLGGRWYDRRGPREMVIIGSVVQMAAQFLISRAATGNDFGVLLWLAVARGIGVGLVFMPILTLGLSTVSRAAKGGASSLLNLIQPVSGAIWVALLTGLYSVQVDNYSVAAAGNQAAAVSQATADVFLVMSVISLGAALLGLLIKAKPQAAAQVEPEAGPGVAKLVSSPK